MSAAEREYTPPDFQAIGTVSGWVTVDDHGRYQLVTSDGLRMKTFMRSKLLKLLNEKSELLGQIHPWTVYPKTDRAGKLFYVYVVKLGGHPSRPVDEFCISGRVSAQAEEDGLIGVRIQANQPQAQPPAGKKALPGQSFPPFYINLHGDQPGAVAGEIWRFRCRRVGLHLEIIDGVRVKGGVPAEWRKQRQGTAVITPPRLKQSQG